MKIVYDNIKFDSELEVNYYKHLKELGVNFLYHPSAIKVSNGNVYTPDFLVEYDDRIEIIETKGYSQFSFMKDNLVHNIMKSKSDEELKEYVKDNNYDSSKNVLYRKIKYLQKYGWVDFSFKNPNSAIKNSRAKVKDLKSERQTDKTKIREYERIIILLRKEKLNKQETVRLNILLDKYKLC